MSRSLTAPTIVYGEGFGPTRSLRTPMKSSEKWKNSDVASSATAEATRKMTILLVERGRLTRGGFLTWTEPTSAILLSPKCQCDERKDSCHGLAPWYFTFAANKSGS